MAPVEIGDDCVLHPEALLGQRLIAAAASGGGKSRTLRMILEALPADFQQIVLDVEDEFHTLRTPDRAYAILGGPYADAPGLERMDPGAVARAMLSAGTDTILQLNDLDLDRQRAFIGDFVGGLMAAPRALWRPLIVVIDESHRYAPQAGEVASSKAIVNLCTAGRKRGFGAFFATQRFSMVSKDVLGQCPNKLIGRVDQTVDRRAAADQLGFTANSDEAMALQEMGPGEMYAMGPAFGGGVTRTRIHPSETEAPKPGMEAPPAAAPSELAAVLAALPAAGCEEDQAPEASSVKLVRDEAAIEDAYQRGRLEGRQKGWADAMETIVRAAREGAPETAPVPHDEPEVQRRTPKATTSGLTGPQARIIASLQVWSGLGFEAPSREQVAFVAKYSPSSGGFNNPLGALRSESYVTYPNAGHVALTEKGHACAVEPAEGLLQRLSGPQRSILDGLTDGEALSREALAARAGYSHTSGGFNNPLGSLRTLGLVRYPQPGLVQIEKWVLDFV